MKGSKGLSWGRGLFRLWLVLSIVWAGIIISIERPDRVFQALMADKERVAEITTALGENHFDTIRDDPSGPWTRFQSQELDDGAETATLEELAQQAAQRRIRAMRAQLAALEIEAQIKRERLQVTAGFAMFPPAVLFFIGATLLWALRGFRRDV